jgi:hypothetical protein
MGLPGQLSEILPREYFQPSELADGGVNRTGNDGQAEAHAGCGIFPGVPGILASNIWQK